jgi:hypothetical protein
MLEIRKLASELEIYVALGFSERDHGSLYLSQVCVLGRMSMYVELIQSISHVRS